MNVSLTPELESLVNKKVQSGRYSSASEVVREALRLLEEQDRLKELRLQQLQREVARGLSDLDSGATSPLDAAAIKSTARKRKKSRG